MSTIAVIAPILCDPISGVELTSFERHHAQIAIHNQLVISAEKMRKSIQMNNRFIIEETNYRHLRITPDNSQNQNTLNIIGHCEDFDFFSITTFNPIITARMLSYVIAQFLLENTSIIRVRLLICHAALLFLNELVSEVIERLIENSQCETREIEFIGPQALSYTYKRNEFILHDVSEIAELLGNSSTKKERKIIQRWKITDETAYTIIKLTLDGNSVINRITTNSSTVR
jgi:hypothetical protein